MAYPRHLLGQDEEIAFELKPHWRALVPPLLWLLVEFGLGIFLLSRWGSWFADNDTVRSVGRWAILGIMLVTFVLATLRPFLYWLTTDYVFTNRRVIVRTGLVARQGRDMPLSKVNNVSFDISVLGRILNFGQLSVVSASDDPLVIRDVPAVERIQLEVSRLHEADDERRRRHGSPVLPDDGA